MRRNQDSGRCQHVFLKQPSVLTTANTELSVDVIVEWSVCELVRKNNYRDLLSVSLLSS